MTEQRRLAAILVADVVGYSKLMGSDEAGTLAQLEALRTEIIEPQIAKYAGRLFKSVGDGFLIEFSSAVQAVSCAKAIQEANGPERLPLRIGIHVGDVVVQGDDLMGDGVNVAARVEGIAEPGGIAITRAVHEQVRDKLDLGFMDKGNIELKNIQRPVQVFVIPGTKVESRANALPLPDKPSIAVLPFQNISGDPEQEYFADGMVDDIITALSRTKALFVIARNSSFAYKGKSPDIRQVGQELGVRYVLEGSVRRAAKRVRISAQLIEAQTGTHIWADRFEGDIGDVFELQDQVTSTAVGSMLPNMDQAEFDRARRKPTDHLEAYDLYLQGRYCWSKYTDHGNTEALNFFYKAIELDPAFALPYAHASGCISYRKIWSWGWASSAVDVREGERLARKALELDRTDPRVLLYTGWTLAYLCERIEEGGALVRLAVEADPNNFSGWNNLGWISLFAADPRALEYFHRAVRLNPLHPFLFGVHNGIAVAHFQQGNYQLAIEWSSKVQAVQPKLVHSACVRASALALTGRLEEARAACTAVRTLDPPVFLSNLNRFFNAAQEGILNDLKKGLRLAGLPE